MNVQLLVLVLAALFGLGEAGIASARAGAWKTMEHSRVRLVVAGKVEGRLLDSRVNLPAPRLLAGVEIRLDPGWKTYWRTPGDGIPPHFDWTGSRNVAALKVLWPAPRHFKDELGAYNGYTDRVVLPFVVVPEARQGPVMLKLKLDYAICKDICIPVTARLSADVAAAAGEAAQRMILTAVEKTPVRAEDDGRCRDFLAFEQVRAELEGDRPELRIAVAHPPDTTPVQLFAEASNGQFIPRPVPIGEGSTGRTVYRADLREGGDPLALSGETLSLTAVSGARSCEMAWSVK